MYKSIVGIALLTLITSFANAAELIPFANGQKTNADDINSNFNELATRINAMPEGTEGPPGPPGADGAGVVTYSWIDYRSTAYDSKVFLLTSGNGTSSHRIESYTRSSNGDGTGITLKKFYFEEIDATPVDFPPYTLQHLEWDTAGDIVLALEEFYGPEDPTVPNNIVLLNTRTYSPPRLLRTSNMGLGMSWGDANTASDSTDIVTIPPTPTNFINVLSYNLLSVENITVQGFNYASCLKIERRYSAYYFAATTGSRMNHRIEWWCPDGVGLVKKIHIGVHHADSNGTTSSGTTTTEFLPDDPRTTLAP